MANENRRNIFTTARLPVLALPLLGVLALFLLLTAGNAGAQSASSSAALSRLELNSQVTPSFDPDITVYNNALIPGKSYNVNNQHRITVDATPTTGASVSFNVEDANKGAPDLDVDISEGKNTIVAMVTAADGVTTREYVVTVWRYPDSLGDLVQTDTTTTAREVTLGSGSSNLNQWFNTGPSENGYTVHAMRLWLLESGGSDWEVTILDRFGAVVGEFFVEGVATSTDGAQTIPALRPFHLEPDAFCRLMVWKKSGTWSFRAYDASGDTAGSDSVPGWYVENQYRLGSGRSHGAATSSRALDLRFYGEEVDDTAPALSSVTSAGNKITLTYDDRLDPGSTPAVDAYGVKANTVAQTINSVSVSGREVVLRLAAPLSSGATATVPVSNAIRNLGQQAMNDDIRPRN